MDRLDKLLSQEGILSRSDTKRAIRKKEIIVNGDFALTSDMKIKEDDIVLYKGERLVFHKFVYLMLNKPKGIISATSDKSQKTVLDIIPKNLYRKDLFPCGRLDKDTEGLLIITNDGESAHRRLSPKSQTEKKYYFKLIKDLDINDLNKLESGVILKDGLKTSPSKILLINEKEGYITITEGKYHEIRRMFASINNTVVELKRISFGNIVLDESLAPSEVRELTKEEIIEFTK